MKMYTIFISAGLNLLPVLLIVLIIGTTLWNAFLRKNLKQRTLIFSASSRTDIEQMGLLKPLNIEGEFYSFQKEEWQNEQPRPEIKHQIKSIPTGKPLEIYVCLEQEHPKFTESMISFAGWLDNNRVEANFTVLVNKKMGQSPDRERLEKELNAVVEDIEMYEIEA